VAGGAAARRAEAREGLWTRSRRRGRGREADPGHAAAAASGSLGLGGDLACGGCCWGRRERAIRRGPLTGRRRRGESAARAVAFTGG
jgi:hypothetical protein